MQDPCPGRGVEEGGLVAGEEQLVPVGKFNRIYDLEVQFFMVRQDLRDYQDYFFHLAR